MAEISDKSKHSDELDLAIGWTSFRASARGKWAIAAVVIALVVFASAPLWFGS